MTLRVADARMVHKRTLTALAVPTVSPSEDHTDGSWSVNDIYSGEFYLNETDVKLYIRIASAIVEIPLGAVGDGDGIYDGNGTIPTTTVSTITDTINFTGGNFGIGVTPTSRLHVLGNTLLDGAFTVKDSTTFNINSAGNLCQIGSATMQMGIGIAASTNYRLRIGGGADGGMNFMFRISDTSGVVLQSVGTTGATIISSSNESSFGFGTLYDNNVLVKIGGGTKGGQNVILDLRDSFNANRQILDISGNMQFNVRSNVFNGLIMRGDTHADILVINGNQGRVGMGNAAPTEKLDVTGVVKASGGYKVGANVGITEVLNFNGVASGEVLTMTVTGGIVTARTLVP